MAPPLDPKLPESAYAPPRSEVEEPYGLGVRVGWVPVLAIATGVAVSSAWAIYVDLALRGGIGERSLLRIAATVILWGGLTSLMITRVSWARAACRVLALLTVVGTLASLWSGGSILFHVADGLRVAIFALVFVLLRPRRPNRPPPLWMQSP